MIEPYEFTTCPNKVVSIQYGIITPTTIWYYVDGEAKAVYEYNPDEHGRPATDKEIFEAIRKLVGNDIDVIIDVQAHAASLIEYIRRNSNYKIHTYLCGFRGGK